MVEVYNHKSILLFFFILKELVSVKKKQFTLLWVVFAQCMTRKWKIPAQHEPTWKFYTSPFPEGQNCITQPLMFTTRNCNSTVLLYKLQSAFSSPHICNGWTEPLFRPNTTSLTHADFSTQVPAWRVIHYSAEKKIAEYNYHTINSLAEECNFWSVALASLKNCSLRNSHPSSSHFHT